MMHMSGLRDRQTFVRNELCALSSTTDGQTNEQSALCCNLQQHVQDSLSVAITGEQTLLCGQCRNKRLHHSLIPPAAKLSIRSITRMLQETVLCEMGPLTLPHLMGHGVEQNSSSHPPFLCGTCCLQVCFVSEVKVEINPKQRGFNNIFDIQHSSDQSTVKEVSHLLPVMARSWDSV
jgi:hypothetical protein